MDAEFTCPKEIGARHCDHRMDAEDEYICSLQPTAVPHWAFDTYTEDELAGGWYKCCGNYPAEDWEDV